MLTVTLKTATTKNLNENFAAGATLALAAEVADF